MTRSSSLRLIAAVALASLFACGFRAVAAGGAFEFAYLSAFAFAGTTLQGALALLMIAHATSASWFVALRRLAEAIASSILLLPLLFAPIAGTLSSIYPWAQPFAGRDEPLRAALTHAAVWLNPALFLARAFLFMLLWIALFESLRRSSLAEDRGAGEPARRRQIVLSALGLPLLAFSSSFASFDWVMSAVPGWNFNVLGLYLLSGGFAAAVGALCVAVLVARRSGRLPAQVSAAHAHALGRLLLTSVCVWAYLAASQLVVVWSANLPVEAGFYLARYRGSFRILALTLVFGHFVLPFLILLGRRAKRSLWVLAAVGGWLVILHAIDVYWLLMPAAPLPPGLWDLAPFALLSSLALCCGTLRFARSPAIPVHAAELERSLAYESP